MDEDLDRLARKLGAVLQQRGMVLVTAESCTGGWVAKVITDIPGSSGWFDRGFITYTNEAKQQMLGVDEQTLADHGAVSEQVAREMVEGARAHSSAGVALSISGIAGPGGGTIDKPVGTVWFAWLVAAAGIRTQRRIFAGDRQAVRRQAVNHALAQLLELLHAAS